MRAKEVQLLEYLKDFEKNVDRNLESQGYNRLREVEKQEDFEKLREQGLFEEYQQEIELLVSFVEVSLDF